MRAASAEVAAAPPSQRVDRACAILLAALWGLALVRIAQPSAWAEELSGALVGIFTIIAVATGGFAARVLSLALLAGAATMVYIYEAPQAFWSGLERSVLFAAFLPTLSLVRGVARSDPRLEAYRARADAAPRPARPLWTLSGAYAVASFLSVGASAVFASLLRADAPEEPRASDARASVCGSTLAILWSPFFVALAVTTEFIPAVNFPLLILSGFALSALGLIVASRVYAPREPLASLGEALRALRLLALPIIIVTGALVLVREVAGLSTIESMLVVLPLFCFGRAAWRGRETLLATSAEGWRALGRIRGEVAIVTSAMIFGTTLTTTPALEALAPLETIAAAWPPALVICCVAAMAGTAFLGIHPLVAGTVALGVLTTAGPSLSDLGLALTVLAGWSASSMLSMSSLMVLAAAAQYGVRPDQIVLGRSLLFFVVFLPLEAAAIVGLDRLA